MDAVQQAVTQMRGLWRCLAPPLRLVTGLLVLVVVIGLTWLVRYEPRGGDELLLAGRTFSPSELRVMEAGFAAAGLSDYEVRDGCIRIPRQQRAAYVNALSASAALPANFHMHVDQALSGSSPFESQQQRQFRIEHARQKELALVVRSLRGIEDATVQFDERDLGGFPRRREITAMVGVVGADERPLSPERVRSIRELVVAAKAGLRPENVTVTDLRLGQTYPGSRQGDFPVPGESPYLAIKSALEKEWTEKILVVLRFVPGVEVAVNVEPELAVPGAEPPSGRADAPPAATGTAARPITHLPHRPAFAPPPAAGNMLSQDAPPGEVEPRHQQLQTPIFVPRTVSVSVGVPRSYLVRIWRERHPQIPPAAPTPIDPQIFQRLEEEAIRKIESAVTALLPAADPPQPRQVIVTTFDDLSLLSSGPSNMDNVEQAVVLWISRHWAGLGTLILAAACLWMLRGFARPARRARDNGPSGQPQFRLYPPRSAANSVTDEPTAAGEQDDGPELNDDQLRSQLTRMVRADPDAAARVLSQWVGRAG